MYNILKQITMVDKKFHCYVRKECEKLGINQSYHGIIMMLGRFECLSQQALSDKLYLSKPTISITLQKMEMQNIIVRKQDETDARIINVSLTEEGKVLDEKIKSVFASLEKEVALALGEDVEVFNSSDPAIS